MNWLNIIAVVFLVGIYPTLEIKKLDSKEIVLTDDTISSRPIERPSVTHEDFVFLVSTKVIKIFKI